MSDNFTKQNKEIANSLYELDRLSMSFWEVGLKAASEKIHGHVETISKALEAIKKEFGELNQARYNDAMAHFGSISNFILNPKLGEMVNSTGVKEEVIKRIKWHSKKSNCFTGQRWLTCRHRHTHVSEVDFDNFDGSEEELINLLENIIIRYNMQG